MSLLDDEMPPRFHPNALLNEKQAAEILNITVNTLRNNRCNGKGPIYCKKDGNIRYRFADLLDFINNSRRRPDGNFVVGLATETTMSFGKLHDGYDDYDWTRFPASFTPEIIEDAAA